MCEFAKSQVISLLILLYLKHLFTFKISIILRARPVHIYFIPPFSTFFSRKLQSKHKILSDSVELDLFFFNGSCPPKIYHSEVILEENEGTK